MYHIDLSLKLNVCITYHHARYHYYYTGTDPVGAPPVGVIIGATVGAIFVVLIIIIITVVSIVLMRRKRGKS